jgi:FAD/FMN-containing dehydrogenase
MATLSRTVVESFRAGLRGDVVLPDDPGYDAARAVWNAMIDRRPAIIVRCEAASDARHALAVARARGLRVAVRGGGHNIAGNGVCDEGVVIDLGPMRSVTVEPTARRVYVEPGATLGEVDRETQKFGLATPLGINSTTGVAGLVLGGGFGWLSRQLGLSVDNLVSCNVLTAAGQLLHASSAHNPDLFWALRGGGGNFGIVTLFELALHPIGPEILAGMLVFPATETRSILAQYRRYAAQIPEDLALWVVLHAAPPFPFLPPALHGKHVVSILVCHTGDRAEGLRLVDPIRRFGTLLGDGVGPMPYVEWQRALDAALAPGFRNYWKSHNLVSLDDGLLDVLEPAAALEPTPFTDIFIGQLGGAASRVAVDETAYPHRDAQFVLNAHARWQAPEDDARCIAWARELFRQTARYATGGAYVNFLSHDEAGRVEQAYGANYARLAQIKRRWDPDNVFCQNQNIAPAFEAPSSRRAAPESQPASRH